MSLLQQRLDYCASDTERADDALQISTAMLPLIVDLDQTLILTDSLHEQIAIAVFSKPACILRAAGALVRGRAAAKASLCQDIVLPAATMPLCESLIDWLRGEAARGREIHLCSAANQSIVDAIAGHLPIFTTATGSDAVNLKGRAKADYLARRFPHGFVYVGDSEADLAVWGVAKGIVLVNAPARVARAAHGLGKPVEAEFRRPPLTTKDQLKALRVHHWSKNALIFVPLILAHAWSDIPALSKTMFGLLCLLLVTSATYLVNDIADLHADRQHWSKRHRALASGKMPLLSGALLAALALALGFGGAFLLSFRFAEALFAYLALTLAYSFGLKRVPLLDTFLIGCLFTMRLVMGMTLLDQVLSEWLLIFSMFFFSSLATAKRHTEIVRSGAVETHSLASRGYRVEDAPLTLVIGVASSIASLLIMMLFIIQELQQRHLYHHPKLLWAIPAVLALWISRIWLLAHRGEMNDDPVSFALRDKASLILGAAAAAFFVIAL